jgi:hypothetical protein
MNLREEVVFGIFPVLARLHEESNTRRQRFCRFLGAEAPNHSDDLDTFLNPLPAHQSKVDFLSGNSRWNSLGAAIAEKRPMSLTGFAADRLTAIVSDQSRSAGGSGGISNATLN